MGSADHATCLEDDELLMYVERRASPRLAQRVRLHMQACDACRALVSELAREQESDPGLVETQPTWSDDVSHVPLQIGRFRVIGALGVGTTGMVVAAFDPELERKVAIKLLRSDRTQGPRSEEAQARLIREAKAMARLAHPNVVSVHDVGTIDERVFLAMELVEGQTLRSWLEAEPRSIDSVLSVFLQAASGLCKAHQAGLVHRDFKPENVLVGHDGRVRVTDFGLAGMDRRAEVRAFVGPTALSLTQSGVAIGTPLYMAPEQHRGDPVDGRADQFAFCVALFEALTGRHPFRAHSYAELLEDMQRASTLTRGLRSVPSAVRKVLRRGLALEPSARFASMDALVHALEARRGWRTLRLWATGLAALLAAGALASMRAADAHLQPRSTSAPVAATATPESRARAMAPESVAPGPTVDQPADQPQAVRSSSADAAKTVRHGARVAPKRRREEPRPTAASALPDVTRMGPSLHPDEF